MLTSLPIRFATTARGEPLVQHLAWLSARRGCHAAILTPTPHGPCRYVLLTAASSQVSPTGSWPGCPAAPRPQLPRAPLAPS